MRAGGMPLFGRDEERAELVALTRDPAVRVATVTGRAGVGKTAIARSVVEVLERAGCRTAIVELAGLTDADGVPAAFAAALDLAVVPGASPVDAVVAELVEGEAFLLVDNFEHVAAATPVLDDLVSRCAGLTLLVTSQAPLRLRDEHVYRLGPLPVPEAREADPEALALQPAVAMYCAVAQAADHRFRSDGAALGAIAALCRELDGLPLAIELAAARAATLPADEILRRLDTDRLDVLRRPRVDAPERHHDLRAAIGWTFDLLTRDVQELLGRLAIVSGTFDVDAVVALAGREGALDDLEALVDVHLVERVGEQGRPRFRIPSSIQTFAREWLATAGLLDDAQRAHVHMRARDLEHASRAVAAGRETWSLEHLATDHDDLMAALASALDLGEVPAALTIAVGLAPLWDARGYLRVHRELLDGALDAAAEVPSVVVQCGPALLWSGLLGLRHGVRVPVEELVGRIAAGEDLARERGDTEALLQALTFWLLAAPYTGDLERARRASEEGMLLAAETGAQRWLGALEAWSGMLASISGAPDRALELGRSALRRAQATRDGRTTVLATMLLLPLCRERPELRAELPPIGDVVVLAHDSGLPLYEALLRLMLIGDSVAGRDLVTATEQARRALATARAMPGGPLARYTIVALVSLVAAYDDLVAAAQLYGAIASALPVLAATMAPQHVEMTERTADAIRASLGARAESLIAQGAAMTPAEALDVAGASLQAHASRAGAAPLTPRQRDVLRLLASGIGDQEIAARLGISPKTVGHHLTALYRKLGARGRTEAVALAVRNGWA